MGKWDLLFLALRKAGLGSRCVVAAQGGDVDLKYFISTFLRSALLSCYQVFFKAERAASVKSTMIQGF
jgi:hypothetical protein